MERTFLSLVDQGLALDNVEHALKNLLLTQKKTKKSLCVLQEFLDSVSANEKFYSIAEEKMNALLPDFFEVRCFDGVKKVLENFSKKVPICLVTKGVEEYQEQKLKKAGIDRAIFSKIIVTREKNKKIHYTKLMKYFDSQKLIACGDHVDGDLVPAKQLNGTTIYVGESNRPLDKDALKYLDYRVEHFFQVEPILEKLIG